MIVLGLDLSLTSTGWATGPGNYGTLEPPKRCNRGIPRIDWIMRRVLELAQDADLVVIEGYAMGVKRTSHAHGAGELGGLVKWALNRKGFAYVDVPPSCLKKFATGKGNANKEAMLAAAIRRLGYAGHSNDEADAQWLRQAGLVHHGCGEIELPKTHLEGLRKVQWNKQLGGRMMRDELRARGFGS